MAAVFIYTMMNAILLFYSCDYTFMKAEGRVTTTLPEVAAVCNGSQLELNCTITGSVLEWRIIPEQNHSQLSATTHYPTRNQSFQYGDSIITFTIISHPMELTLYRIVISPVTNSLNGTEVECTDFEDQELSSSTVIKIVNDQDFESIMVRTISEDFNRKNVKVSLEWVPDSSLHTYHVNVTPQPAFSMKLKRNSICLKVEYNVLYNLSIMEMSPCGQAITINEIVYYVSQTCGHPFQDVGNGSVIIKGYMDPSLEGAVLSFNCPPQYVLIGPNTTVCMGNGEWEPDPREVKCKGLYLESRTSHEILTAAVSSTISFLMISILTLATGVACGYYFARRRRKQSSSLNQPTEPLYEDMNPLSSAVEHLEQGLKLKENVAYGTAKPIDPLHHETLPSAVEHHLEQGLELTENVAYGTTKSMTH